MDNEELNKCLSGMRDDMHLFDELYNELKTPAFTVIMRIVKDRALSEDVLQELFLKIYRSPPRNVKKPRAYILEMARNMAIDSLKKHSAETAIDELEIESQDADITGKLDIENAIRKLDPADSEIVTLHLNGGLTFRETAAIMKMPLGTVLWRYRRAIDRLRMILSGGTE